MITLTGVTKSFGPQGRPFHALRDVSLSIGPSEMVAIVGPSGSGKSTLLSLLGIIDRPSAGTYHYAGEEVGDIFSRRARRLRNESFGFIMQDYCLIPYYTVQQNVALPLRYSRKRVAASARVSELLSLVGLEDKARSRPFELSGGQQQRVAIARALANGPDYILADEPTGALDTDTGEEILRLLRARCDAGVAGVLVTHEARHAAWADRVVFLRDGVVVDESGIDPVDALLEPDLSR